MMQNKFLCMLVRRSKDHDGFVLNIIVLVEQKGKRTLCTRQEVTKLLKTICERGAMELSVSRICGKCNVVFSSEPVELNPSILCGS
eukprot:XP_001707101.1 Hypothetical protein GL50803_102477 [Giardia lamblia ATCC 50803]